MMVLAAYLVNKATGAPLVYLIVAAVLLAVALVLAGWTRDLYRALIAAGVGFIVLALLTH
jgi:Na+-translocating ferredoxin:NAD+ oxidoreductase RnfE subunit